MYDNKLINILYCKYYRDTEEMFVLHSDCSNLFKKCQYCCSEESTRNNDQTSDSQQVQPTPEQPSTETLVDESNVSTDSSENPTDDVVLNNDQAPEQHLSSTTSSSSNPNDIEVSTNVPEKKKQRDVDYIAEEEAEEASVIKAATSSLISDEQEGGGVVAVAEPKNDQLLINSVGIGEKMENQLKEQKDPIMGADLILLDFDISLVHNQSRVEALLLSHTFIGCAFRSSSKEENVTAIDDTVVNVEYQGDNIVGCFDSNGNHAFESSGGQRRLYGAVYSVRKYQQLTDTETTYAVIIWIDAAVKDKAEIEIASFDDYFELLNLS